ncbi:GTP-binding protein [Lacrimispora sp.]|uniref:GTP-binding protein n=1 Tax=Lacrimispora sp. TaxID=2719234 RepID=UPI002FD98FD0
MPMKLITVSGPPSAGKTSVLIRIIEQLGKDKAGVAKFDCLSSSDAERFEEHQIRSIVGLSGNLCPDHFFVSNIEECVEWGFKNNFEYLVIESAGLCNRCSPHLREFLGVCVIDNLSGINTPHKIGPMLRYADLVMITKGDIVSQAEREVFAFKVKMANPKADVLFLNGITGQGSFDGAEYFRKGKGLDSDRLEDCRLRFAMPAALCSYCLGETRVGESFQKGNIKKMKIG